MDVLGNEYNAAAAASAISRAGLGAVPNRYSCNAGGNLASRRSTFGFPKKGVHRRDKCPYPSHNNSEKGEAETEAGAGGDCIHLKSK